MTNEEIRKRLTRFDELIHEADGIPSTVIKLKRDREKFLEANPIISPSIKAREVLKQLITNDARMLEVKAAAETLAPYPDAALIIGESGTGKEIIAHALHGDRTGNFIPINCAGLPEHLVESELFGHIRGSFTGAETNKEGLFERANKGTLFLDEIGELGLQLQAKLLRVLQEGTYRRVGDTVEMRTTARIISATHHNLVECVTKKTFRLDLYARLSTFTLVTIPIRNRRDDIRLIVDNLDASHKLYDEIESSYHKIWKGDLIFNVRDIQRIVRQWQVFGKIMG